MRERREAGGEGARQAGRQARGEKGGLVLSSFGLNAGRSHLLDCTCFKNLSASEDLLPLGHCRGTRAGAGQGPACEETSGRREGGREG